MRDAPRVANEALGATQKQLQALVDRLLWGLLALVSLVGTVLVTGFLVLRKKGLRATGTAHRPA